MLLAGVLLLLCTLLPRSYPFLQAVLDKTALCTSNIPDLLEWQQCAVSLTPPRAWCTHVERPAPAEPTAQLLVPLTPIVIK